MGGKTYCVTGSTGYIGSWLVKYLLERGCTVHATLRNPEKASHFINSWRGNGRVQLFRADLMEEGSFDEAVRGCDGVFHVAASMEFSVPPAQDDLETYAKTEVVDPAIRGTLNVLKACLRSDVRRVVFTSSISTLTAKDSSGKWLSVVDEHCQVDVSNVLKAKASGWVYVFSKRLTEEAAFRYAEENGIDLISIITTTVGGLFLTPTVPTSIQVLLSPITGDSRLLPILNSVNSRMGSIALVHVEDICSAHAFLMEHDGAEGRYLCCTGSCTVYELVEHFAKEYPSSISPRGGGSIGQESAPVEISSKKIREMGFEFKYNTADVIHHTLSKCLDSAFLPLKSVSTSNN